jgi:hypothetical protein
MRGYPVLRVPTVALGPILGEAANPRVGPTSFPRATFLSLYVLGFRSGGAAQLMSGAWTHLSVPGYAKRAVWARNAAPDGLLLAGEEK